MKKLVRLDPADRQALATVATYVALVVVVLVLLAGLSVDVGLCVHLFRWAAGV